ncbi:unnamed protein product [Fraxinus pennsylvanica]|uniref:Uncharacterized protein n=1 Tax=Fraxinus pennsylvanica TaxID=56036 RepID=A0AAD1ZW11_9LAMI|nr:unnamed protein product [Fraxinus pennsylvanica]
MSGKGSFAVSRSHGGDRFYNPPAVRRQQQMLLQQQQLTQKQQLMHQQQQQELQTAGLKTEYLTHAEAGNRSESDDSNAALSKLDSVRSVSPPVQPPPVVITNLDRLMESVTPFIPAHCGSETNARGSKMRKSVSHPFYCLDDLWESLKEWSVYGAGVPLVLNEKDRIIQYYVPYLSGIQLYIDSKKPSSRLRRPGEESDAESSMETSSAGSSDCEADRHSKSVADGSRNQQNLINFNSQRLNKLVLRDKSVISSSSDEAEISNSPGLPVFEYLEQEQPYNRRPLTDKMKVFQPIGIEPYKRTYPIYRIPIGPTLHDLDASFLTFHPLSTHSRSNILPQFHAANTRQVRGIVDPSSTISLPVFGLASYKLKGSILSPCAAHEREQESSLLHVADNWLRNLNVILPDYQFFLAHSQWR